MKGSVRQRGAASWELRVYAGTDPDTGKRRYRTATVVGNRADAERALARLVAEVESDKTIGSASTLSELLEAWFAIASASWAPTTTRETRSILDRCLLPHLGHLRVGDVSPSVIDATYAVLRERGSMRGGPLKPGTLSRIHVVLRSAFSQAMRWGWVWANPWNELTGSSSRRPRCTRRHRPSCSNCSTTSNRVIRCSTSWSCWER